MTTTQQARRAVGWPKPPYKCKGCGRPLKAHEVYYYGRHKYCVTCVPDKDD